MALLNVEDEQVIQLILVPKMKLSRLLFSMYSYTSILSYPWMQQPRSLTRFTCCSLAMSMTSFLNSSKPCVEYLDSRFTATICPPSSFP